MRKTVKGFRQIYQYCPYFTLVAIEFCQFLNIFRMACCVLWPCLNPQSNFENRVSRQARSWFANKRSNNLDTTGSKLIGLQLPLSMGEPFLKLGITSASFNLSGNVQVSMQELKQDVRKGTQRCEASFKMRVGILPLTDLEVFEHLVLLHERTQIDQDQFGMTL